MPRFAAMNDFDAPSSCLISVRDRHRIATLTIREDLLVRVRQGAKTVHAPGRSLRFGAGEFALLARGGQWDMDNAPGPRGCYEARVLAFGARAVRDFQARHAADFPVLPLADCAALPADAELTEAVDRAADTFADPATSSRLRHHRALEVLLLLAERGQVLRPPEDLDWPERVRRLVAQRPDAAWTVDVLAQAFHLSPSSLRRRLAEAEIGAGALVREVRLETGLQLLQTTALPVGEVARRSGYDSHSRFSAAFRARFGFAPSVLRGGEGAPASCAVSGSAQNPVFSG